MKMIFFPYINHLEKNIRIFMPHFIIKKINPIYILSLLNATTLKFAITFKKEKIAISKDYALIIDLSKNNA